MCAPARLASCTAKLPTPPVAPMIRMLSPSCRSSAARAAIAVRPVTGAAPAAVKSTPSGLRPAGAGREKDARTARSRSRRWTSGYRRGSEAEDFLFRPRRSPRLVPTRSTTPDEVSAEDDGKPVFGRTALRIGHPRRRSRCRWAWAGRRGRTPDRSARPSPGSGSGRSSRSLGSAPKSSRTNPFILGDHRTTQVPGLGLDPLPQCVELYVREEAVRKEWGLELIDVCHGNPGSASSPRSSWARCSAGSGLNDDSSELGRRGVHACGRR